MKEKIKAYDECLKLIDTLLRDNGRSNLISKYKIEELRNKIVELQEEEEVKNGK